MQSELFKLRGRAHHATEILALLVLFEPIAWDDQLSVLRRFVNTTLATEALASDD